MRPFFFMILVNFSLFLGIHGEIPIWSSHQVSFTSEASYENPLYDLDEFYAEFTAPSGRVLKHSGFWDGARDWKIRIMPDEVGTWSYRTHCSDTSNSGLHGQQGSFVCKPPTSGLDLYRKGPLSVNKGSWHFTYADGTPFFWQACTAWNGALKSTVEEWEHYLEQRAGMGYNVIQLVATQWRGCSANSRGEVAFTGSGRIRINPVFFRLMDEKIDAVNRHGHVAAIVLLWALPFGDGRELSPGYYLPDQECVRLARYIVARYQGNHITWILGGDGKYYDELEDRWKFIGREVFRDGPPGLVTLHPHGRSWIGDLYAGEEWFDYVGYQSTHGVTRPHVDFINHTVGEGWKTIPACPVINMEPCYEEIRNQIFEDGVRNASYWSMFAAPPSGITYGHDGTWPWLREGEKPENHRYTPEVSTWDKGIELPGSRQVSYLGALMRSLDWWDLMPAQELLLSQPGSEKFDHHVSVLKTRDFSTILVYAPSGSDLSLRLPPGDQPYTARWFDPVNNTYSVEVPVPEGITYSASPPFEEDGVLILSR